MASVNGARLLADARLQSLLAQLGTPSLEESRAHARIAPRIRRLTTHHGAERIIQGFTLE